MTTEGQTGTITIVFTDLVGSTEIMEREGEDEGRELLRRYLGQMREISSAYEGREVKNFGDGIEIAFSSVVTALDTATAMQRTIFWENQAREVEVGLRIGINVCEASIAEGDYWGLSVVVAKRLCDLADAGQILVSGLVRQLVEHRREREFVPLGNRTVKGIGRPIETFELVWTPLDHAPTLPSTSETTEGRALSRFIRAVRRHEPESR
jgi:adenylate cyclase